MSAVLTVNPGSSSLQAHLVDVASERVLDSIHVEQAAESNEATQALTELLGRIGGDGIAAVGHRLVHGGDALRVPTVVDDDAVAAVRQACSLAPLHVPTSLWLLGQLRAALPDVPHVMCPDTAFHSGLPEVAATYALPATWRQRFGLRRYGFHGLSYAWALDRVAAMLGRPRGELSLLLAHLGGGSSVCAVRDGRSVDTSMGFTPLDGVPMAKRSGSVDPGMLLWLLQDNRLDLTEVLDGLYTRSGLFGLSNGRSADTRDLVAAARAGDSAADLALRVFAHRVRRELAAAATSLDHVDALVFTGEIGWDQPEVREDVAMGLGLFGVPCGLSGNRTEDGLISAPDADVPVFAVQPREELQLCRDTMAAVRHG